MLSDDMRELAIIKLARHTEQEVALAALSHIVQACLSQIERATETDLAKLRQLAEECTKAYITQNNLQPDNINAAFDTLRVATRVERRKSKRPSKSERH